jgi:dTDP-4-dehydrorhamnose reductase
VKALVLGSAGQLGRELVALLGAECAWAGGRHEADVTDADAVAALLARVGPDVVFNATAWNRVDAAETEKAAAHAVNAGAPAALASSARAVGALLVHFSTDYVFDGSLRRPYREDDLPAPLSVYGASKLEGERRVAASGAEHLLLRTSAVLGRGGSGQKGGSFVDRILQRARAGQPLRVVADQQFAPTIAADLASAALALVRSGSRGLYHVANTGSCSWHELARAALSLAGLDLPVERISLADLALPAPRPLYSVLDTARVASLGLGLRPWREALPDVVPRAA